MHQIYSCSDENLEVFTTVISSKSCSPARRRAKATQHILTKSVRKISFPFPIFFFIFLHSSWLCIPSKGLWVNGKQIFQGKAEHPCLMQGAGWETGGRVSVKLQFLYKSTLKQKNKIWSCHAEPVKMNIVAYQHCPSEGITDLFIVHTAFTISPERRAGMKSQQIIPNHVGVNQVIIIIIMLIKQPVS
uniref:Vexin n=1 Tax=Cyanistes caeruleus TaxID=156563 RepID=A0A8C0UV14_CYACU